MIKPRTTFVLFIIVLILAYLFLPWKGLFFILFGLMFLSHLIYCSANICSQAYIKTLCKANISEKKIAITFDDGPNAEITPKVLELLDKYNVKASFFCIGKNIESNISLVQLTYKKGHLIGNHTWTHHRWFDLFSSAKMKNEIEKTNQVIFDVINKKTKLFRPPYGVTNPSLKKAIKNFNFHTIGWSIRSLDTVGKYNKALKKIKKVRPGDIILFHDNHNLIIKLLEEFLRYTQEQGYQIIPLDTLLNIKAYE